MKQANTIVSKAAVAHTSQYRGTFSYFWFHNVRAVVCVQTWVWCGLVLSWFIVVPEWPCLMFVIWAIVYVRGEHGGPEVRTRPALSTTKGKAWPWPTSSQLVCGPCLFLRGMSGEIPFKVYSISTSDLVNVNLLVLIIVLLLVRGSCYGKLDGNSVYWCGAFGSV